MFPKLRKRSSVRTVDVEEMGTGRATDYVFRIIYPGHRHEHSEYPKPHRWRKGERCSVVECSVPQEGLQSGSTH